MTPKPNPVTSLHVGAVLLALLTLTARADYQSTLLSFNPVGYWRLSETVQPPPANIASNWGTFGALGTGFPGLDITNRPAGIVGNCFTFINPQEGFQIDPDSFVDVPNQAAFNPPLGSPFTIEFWAKPSANNNDLVAPIASLNGNASRSGYLVYYDAPNKRWQFRMGGTALYCATVNSANGSAVVGSWQHIVAIYDGTSVFLYLNGALVGGPGSTTGGNGYNPNTGVPFRIGYNTLGNRGFDGDLDEVAFYNTVLSADTVAAHHDAATTNNAGYHAQVLLDNPVGYWPMEEPPYVAPDPSTFPTTANLGTLGSLANGTNNPGLTAGVAGPPFSGFGAGNLGVTIAGGAGNVDLGDPNDLNFDNQITIIAWVKPAFTDGLRDIVAHGFENDSSLQAETFLRINSGNYEAGAWDGTTTFGTNAPMNSAGLGSDVGNWVFLATTYDAAGNWNLYRYDQLVASAPATQGAMIMFNPWSIGSAGPNTEGRFLGGDIDEVAIFTNALSGSQLQQIFYSANVSPIIVTPLPPQAPPAPVFVGTPLKLVAVAAGNPPFAYSWTKNGSSLGNTSTSLSIPSLATTDSGTYALIVTNAFGSTTSSVPINVVLAPPSVVQQPVPAARYVGAAATFSVSVTGSGPFTYQWQSNTVNIAGATASSFKLNAVQLSYAANYGCQITGPGGQTNSASAALTVVVPPTAAYPQAVFTDNPIAYWRLNETNGTVAHDLWGGHDGTYHGSVALNQAGYAPANIDPDPAAGFPGTADTYVGDIANIDPSGTTTAFTLEAWVKGPSSQVGGAGIISKGLGNNGTGGNSQWEFALDVDPTTFGYRLSVDSASGSATASITALSGPDGTWQHVAATYDQGGGTMTIYVNGEAQVSGTPPTGGEFSSPIPVSIGAERSGVTPTYDQPFTGTIDEVAIYNFALGADRILAHVNGLYGLNFLPVFTSVPAPTTNYVGLPIFFEASAYGTVPLSYQWQKDSQDISGATDRTFTNSSVALTDAGNYSVKVTNAAGSTNSAPVALVVYGAPTTPPSIPDLVMHLTFDNTLTDATGRGNNGTGMHQTQTTTNTAPVTSTLGDPLAYVSDGPIGNGALHYSSDMGAYPGPTQTNSYYVTLGTPADLQFGSTASFTVSYWIRLPANYVAGDLPFFTDTLTSTFGHPGYLFAPTYGAGATAANNGTTPGGWAMSFLDINNNGIGVYGDNNSINDGLWHHLVHVIDRQNTMITYLDGLPAHFAIQAGSSAAAATATVDATPPNPATIGQDPTGHYGETGSADIDDLGVWRRALTQLEAASIYIAGVSNKVSFAGSGPVTRVTVTAKLLSNGQVQLSWPSGTLQSAPQAAGTYTDVPGNPASPYSVTPTTGSYLFYRVRQ
jgi:hypothetical protein